MDEEDFRSVVQHALAESVQFVDTELSTDRAIATQYYKGKPFGNEEEGRSQVVLTEVRDAVDGMLPSLMRVAHPPGEHCVEFIATKAENVEEAAQKTDYVRHVYEQDCQGKMQTMALIKDGLIRKLGVITWGWDDSVDTKAYKQEGITREQLELLAADDEVELTSANKLPPTKQMKAEYGQAMAAYSQQMAQQPPQPGQPVPPPPSMPEYYDVELTKTTKGGKPWAKAVPPEEFIFNRQARSVEEALIVGHRTTKTRGQLLAMGIKAEDIEEHAGAGANDTDITLRANAEEMARRDTGFAGQSTNASRSYDPEMGKANAKILYCDVLMNVDFDGDGIAELRRVCTIGNAYYPVKNDPADEKRFAVFPPYPEPHTLLGGSVTDRTMDVQKINSALLRGMLDSLSASIFPRTLYREGDGNIADIMNTAIGAPIRVKTDVQSAVRTLDIPFVGKEAMPILAFMQEVIERRTGRNKGAAGLDADALQSTGKEAVGAVLNGNQEQLELMSVVLAEMAMKPLYEGLGRLLQQKQPRERLVNLRGKWVNVNPKSWDANMDVQVNVNLGSASTEKKVGVLMAVAADQENMLTTMGLSNPFTSAPKFLNTRSKVLSLHGIKDFESYYNALPPDWQPPPAPPTPPDPSIAVMQSEAEMSHIKAMKELVIKHDELSLKVQEMQDRKEGDAFDRAFKLKELEINGELEKAKIQLELSKLQAQNDLDHAQTLLDAHVAAEDHDLAVSEHQHAVTIEHRQADIAETAANKPASPAK